MRTLHTTRTQTQCAHTARNLYNTNTLHTHTLTKDHLYLVANPAARHRLVHSSHLHAVGGQ